MSLVTLADFKLYIGTSSSSGSDSLIQGCLDAAEREVLNYCRRSTAYTGFEQSSGLTRYYKADSIVNLPVGSQYSIVGGKSWDRWGTTNYASNTAAVLWLGDADLLSVDTLTNGEGTTISSGSYWLEPRNKAPYRYIRLKSDESWVFNTDGEVSIAGTWGFSSAADGEIADCVKQTAKYKLDVRASQTFDVTAMPEIGQIAIPKGMPANVKIGLSHGGYRRTLGAY